MDDAAAGDVGVGEHEAAAGVFLCVAAETFHHVAPVSVVPVAVVHEFDLAEVNGFEAHVDPPLPHVDKPHAGFQTAHVRDR